MSLPLSTTVVPRRLVSTTGLLQLRCAISAARPPLLHLSSAPSRRCTSLQASQVPTQRDLTIFGHALHISACFCSSQGARNASSNALEPELISLDCIEVISTTVETVASAAASTAASVSEGATSFTGRKTHSREEAAGSPRPHAEAHAATSASHGKATERMYCDVHNLDPFARGRVANFIRRMGHADGAIFHVTEARSISRETAGLSASPTLFVATCRVPLPDPHGFHIAEGMGEDRKEAELLAAMHAERMCDALGVPLFRLKTAQQKHAETVRQKEGRYAPMPGDPIKPVGTPVPPPLRLLRRLEANPTSSRAADDVAADTTLSEGVGTSSAGERAGPRQTAAFEGSVVQTKQEQVSQLKERSEVASPSSILSECGASNPSTSTAVPKNSTAWDSSRATVDPLRPDSRQRDASASHAAGATSTATAAAGLAATWPTAHTTTFISRSPAMNESRRHNPRQLYDAFVPHFTNAEHAERVRSYASTVVYPWQDGWVEATDARATTDAARRGSRVPSRGDSGGGVASAAHAAAAANVASVVFDPTENGMWQMVNDRNLRCSPSPKEALVLPYVYDGPFALARLTEYYTQHGTTLQEHLTVRSVTTPGHSTRMKEAEMRLVGVSVTARGKSQTEEMAVHLAAMHAELLLDALGRPLFPKDAAQQARHAVVVAGYGRWAPNPLTGSTVPPNPHDALPLPLKSQIGTDDVWLAMDAPPSMQSRRTEEETIIATQNIISTQIESLVEVNPPLELLEEAYAMLHEWQTHIARSRYTNLYVLFNMASDTYRATTITPVPARFGLRGGCGIGVSHERAMQMCALHAMDTLCALGVPLCVDPAQERRYLQRRAALGQVMPTSLNGIGALKAGFAAHAAYEGNGRKHAANAMAKSSPSLAGSVPFSAKAIPHLPCYMHEGQQTRLLPGFADTVHAMQLTVPDDFCLFRGESDSATTEIGNETKTCVSNYLDRVESCRLRAIKELLTSTGAEAAKRSVPYPFSLPNVAATSAQHTAGQRKEKKLSPTIRTVSASASSHGVAPLPQDDIFTTQMWATQYLLNAPPSVFLSGNMSQLSGYSCAYLRVPLPGAFATSSRELDLKDPAAVHKSLEELLNGPAYVLAVGMSLKRKDAVRACYVHAAAILHRLGVDVMAQYASGAPRLRHAPTFAALSASLGTESVVIVPPHTPDGELNTTPLRRVRASATTGAGGALNDAGTEQGAANGASPPLAVMHNILKAFCEDPRHFTRPRRRFSAKGNNLFTAQQRTRF